MKRNIYYPLLMLMAILLPTSCSFEEDVLDIPTSDGHKISFAMDVSLAGASKVESRAFGNTSFNFTSLYIAVFEETEDGSYLKEFLDNDDITLLQQQEDGDVCWKFNVTITEAGAAEGKKYRLHLIANYPGLTIPFGEEGQLMGLLETQGDNLDVYWNFVELTSIDANSVTSLQHVPLVRNYVQIKIDETSNFTGLTNIEYALYNVPTKGRVAAYNTNPAATSKFANFLNGTACQTYDNLLVTQKYAGNEAYDDGSLLSENLAWKDTDVVSYMYERNHSQRVNPTCMLIRGTYNGSTSYYKLDFVDNNGDYYNLLRNFIYTMKVTKVSGPGYDSAEKALNKPAGNNISSDTKTASYTNVSDGTSQLYVSTTSILFTQTQPVDLYFKYIPAISDPTTTSNADVVISGTTGDVLASVSDVVAVTTGQYDGWSRITLYPKDIPAIAASQELTFSESESGLKRIVKLRSQPPYAGMTLNVVQDKVQSASGQDVTLQITLPTGLPESLFPLRLFIRSAANSIYPDYGTNMPAESQNGNYGFIKEVSYDNYNTSKTVTCDFLTNCGNSATTVFVENQYLATASDVFENEKITSITIGTDQIVIVQKDNDRYPYNIYTTNGASTGNNNDNKNNGTEEVTIKLNGTSLSDIIKIDCDNVTEGVVLKNESGFNPEDVLTFEFNDNYWYYQWSIFGGTQEWRSTTYTARCTVAELLSGTKLDFKH